MSEHPFTHLDASGQARMVDVTAKQPTVRAATAAGTVLCSPEVVELLRRVLHGRPLLRRRKYRLKHRPKAVRRKLQLPLTKKKRRRTK